MSMRNVLRRDAPELGRLSGTVASAIAAAPRAGEPPQLAAVLADQQIQPIEIRKFVVALGRFGGANLRVVQHGVLMLARKNRRFGASNRTNGAIGCQRTCPHAGANDRS